MTKVFFCPVPERSFYIQLLLRGLRDRYAPVFREQGGLRLATEHLEAGLKVLVHVHWEEFFLLGVADAEEARAQVEAVEADLAAFVARGGKVVLTIHNGLPHRSPHVEAFLALRRSIARTADLILVHNRRSATVLQEQTGLDGAALEAKLRLLPHPAYTGLYESAERTAAALDTLAPEPLVLGFGAMQKQKGFDRMLEALTPAFTAAHGARIRLSGEGREGPRLRARHGARADIDWDLRFLPQAEVGPLFRRAACLVLPYERFLTSGVALLALTLGGLVVARDAPQLREILPEAARRLLYRHDDPDDLRRAVAEALALAPAESRDLRRAGLAVAAGLAPERIGAELGAHYDRLVAQTRPPRPEHAAVLDAMERIAPEPATAEPVTGTWPARDTVSRNWGDKLNPLLIALMSGRPVLNAERMQNDGTAPIHLVIGSGLSGAGPRHAVWGSGFIRQDAPIPAPRAIHAVRGPLSRDRLRAAGVACPAVYGDPALLLPLFYRPRIAPSYDLGLILHFRDAAAGEPPPAVPDGLRVRVIDILGPLTEVIDAILSCRAIASSSLHGLIAAHAYGVPATWIKFGNHPKGDDFKFRDYWASVGWPDAEPLWVGTEAGCIGSCADLVGSLTRTPPRVDIPALIAACPFADPERKAALLRRAAAVFPALPAVAFLAAALPDPALTWVSVEPERWSGADAPLLSVLMAVEDTDPDTLDQTLGTIRDGEAGARVEIVLADLGSRGREARTALARRFDCRLLHPDGGTWNRAQGLDAAAAAARGHHLLVLGSGHAVGPRSLVTLRAYLEALPEAVHLTPAEGPPQDTPSGLACTTDLFDSVGGFDTGLPGAPTTDFLRRAREMGHPLNRIVHPDLQVRRLGADRRGAAENGAPPPETRRDPSLPAARPRPRRPRVSVVIATRDRARALVAAIRSVLAQTMPDLEVVVVDEGSTDGTAAAVSAIMDARLRLIRTAWPGGRANARNHGVRAATGRYVAMQDEDALMLPDRLERQLAALRAGDAGSYGGVVETEADAAGAETVHRPGSETFALGPQLFGPAPLAHGTLLIRRSVCLNHPYDARVAAGAEEEMIARLADAGYGLRHCGRYLVVHPEGRSDADDAPRRLTAAARLTLLAPEAEAGLRAAAEAAGPAAIVQPELDAQLAALLGPGYGVGTDTLPFCADLFAGLLGAGVPLGVEVGKAGPAIEPRALVLDQADRAAYTPPVGGAALDSGPLGRRPRVRAERLDSRFTERYLADDRAGPPDRPPSAAAIAFLRAAGGRAAVLRFPGHWPGFAQLNLLLDTAETALLWFDGTGGWEMLMRPCDPVELGVRVAVASRGRPGTGLHLLVLEEPA